MKNINLSKNLIDFAIKSFKFTFSTRSGHESIRQIALIAIPILMISTYLHSSKKKLPPATPQAETTPQITNTLRAKGIYVEQASRKDSNVFICANRNLTYIDRATKNLSEHEKKGSDTFSTVLLNEPSAAI